MWWTTLVINHRCVQLAVGGILTEFVIEMYASGSYCFSELEFVVVLVWIVGIPGHINSRFGSVRSVPSNSNFHVCVPLYIAMLAYSGCAYQVHN